VHHVVALAARAVPALNGRAAIDVGAAGSVGVDVARLVQRGDGRRRRVRNARTRVDARGARARLRGRRRQAERAQRRRARAAEAGAGVVAATDARRRAVELAHVAGPALDKARALNVGAQAHVGVELAHRRQRRAGERRARLARRTVNALDVTARNVRRARHAVGDAAIRVGLDAHASVVAEAGGVPRELLAEARRKAAHQRRARDRVRTTARHAGIGRARAKRAGAIAATALAANAASAGARRHVAAHALLAERAQALGAGAARLAENLLAVAGRRADRVRRARAGLGVDEAHGAERRRRGVAELALGQIATQRAGALECRRDGTRAQRVVGGARAQALRLALAAGVGREPLARGAVPALDAVVATNRRRAHRRNRERRLGAAGRARAGANEGRDAVGARLARVVPAAHDVLAAHLEASGRTAAARRRHWAVGVQRARRTGRHAIALQVALRAHRARLVQRREADLRDRIRRRHRGVDRALGRVAATCVAIGARRRADDLRRERRRRVVAQARAGRSRAVARRQAEVGRIAAVAVALGAVLPAGHEARARNCAAAQRRRAAIRVRARRCAHTGGAARLAREARRLAALAVGANARRTLAVVRASVAVRLLARAGGVAHVRAAARAGLERNEADVRQHRRLVRAGRARRQLAALRAAARERGRVNRRTQAIVEIGRRGARAERRAHQVRIAARRAHTAGRVRAVELARTVVRRPAAHLVLAQHGRARHVAAATGRVARASASAGRKSAHSAVEARAVARRRAALLRGAAAVRARTVSVGGARDAVGRLAGARGAHEIRAAHRVVGFANFGNRIARGRALTSNALARVDTRHARARRHGRRRGLAIRKVRGGQIRVGGAGVVRLADRRGVVGGEALAGVASPALEHVVAHERRAAGRVERRRAAA